MFWSLPKCTTLLTCAPAPPLGSTFSALLLVQTTSVAAPLLVLGPSFLPGTQAPITMQGPAFPPIRSAPIVFSGALVVPLAPQSAMQSAGAPQGTAIPPMAGVPWPIQATPYSIMHLWPIQLGQCICLVICLGPRHSRSPCKLSLNSLL